MPSDLHTHTAFSDGRLTPEELVAAAKAAGLSYLAITDHDTVDGIKHLYEQGLYPSKTLHIIPGIEFSSEVDGHDVHILGYDFDMYDQELIDKVGEIAESRWARFSLMIEKLHELGYNLTETDVMQLAGASRSIGRAHIARALVKKGLVPTVREAFDRLLEHGQPVYVPHYRLPVLAHPKKVRDDVLVEKLLELDFGGVEVYYPTHEAADTERYIAMAKKHNLRLTGGSDFHASPNRIPAQLGEFTIDDELAAPFFHPPASLT